MMTTYTSKLVQFVGAPGAGKTTLAHQFFSWLKTTGEPSVFVSEEASEWIRDGKHCEDQLLLSLVQNHKFYNALGNFQYIVTDTHLLLGMIYIAKPHANPKFQEMDDFIWDNIKWQYIGLLDHINAMYDSITFFKELEPYPFQMEGRYHSKEQATEIEKEIKELLTSRRIEYMIANDLQTCIDAYDWKKTPEGN